MRNFLEEKENMFGIKVPTLLINISQFMGIFLVTFVILYAFNFVPNQFHGPSSTAVNKVSDTVIAIPESTTRTTPDSISIKSIGITSEIEKPNSQNVAVLDAALNKGAVYYPGSGSIENGNMFLFGHSAGAFSWVNNKAYKVFDNLEKLNSGDEIEIVADGKLYVYSVESVSLVDENTAFVDFTKEGRRLTLSTCNTFGEAQDRWVVEAVFKENRSI